MKLLISLALIMFMSTPAFAGLAFFQTNVTATTTSTQILAAESSRRYLIVQNQDAAISITVKTGSASSSASDGVIVPAGGSYEAGQAPVDSVFIRSASGTPAVVVIQGR